MFGREWRLAHDVEVVFIHKRKGLLVSETFIAADDGVGEVDGHDLGLIGEGNETGLREPVLCFN